MKRLTLVAVLLALLAWAAPCSAQSVALNDTVAVFCADSTGETPLYNSNRPLWLGVTIVPAWGDTGDVKVAIQVRQHDCSACNDSLTVHVVPWRVPVVTSTTVADSSSAANNVQAYSWTRGAGDVQGFACRGEVVFNARRYSRSRPDIYGGYESFFVCVTSREGVPVPLKWFSIRARTLLAAAPPRVAISYTSGP